MLIEVREFCRRIERDIEGLVRELQTLTEREGEEEASAWEASLPQPATACVRSGSPASGATIPRSTT